MELKKLEQQRDSYAGKIGKLAIQIALIFAIPAALGIGISKYFDISLWYLGPVFFVISWIMVIILYRKIDKEVGDIEAKIISLKKKEELENNKS